MKLSLIFLCLSAFASAQDFVCQAPMALLQTGKVYYCMNAEAQRVWAVTYGPDLGVFTQIPLAQIVATGIAAKVKSDSYNFYSTANGQRIHVSLTKAGSQKYLQLAGDAGQK
jgi:hypothetical protein